MSLTADQLNTIYNSVLERNVDQGGITYYANRTDISDAQVRLQIETSPEANTYVSPIVRLYDAALHRVPDAAGLKFFVQNLETTGSNISTISAQILNSSEFAANAQQNGFAGINGTSAANSAFVQYVFNDILGRPATAQDVSYYTAKTAAVALAEIVNSSESVNRNAANVTTYLDSAATGQTNSGPLGQQTTPGGSQVGGQNFTFSTGNNFETLTGTAGNDTFTGLAADVQSTDTVNGGAGIDAVRIFNAAGTPALPTLNSVEQLIFVAPTAGLTVDTTNVTGLQIVNSQNQTIAGTTTGTAGTPVTAANVVTDTFTVKAGVAVGLDNVHGSAAQDANNAAGVANVTVNTAAAATSQTVYLANGSAVGALTLNGAGLTSDSLDSAGSAANSIKTLVTTGTTTTLNLSGAQKLTITDALDANLKTVNASADTGGVSLKFQTADVSVTGGSGADRFDFGTTLTTADTVVGGAGTDTIVITGNNFSAAGAADPSIATQINALNTKVTGVEVLEITGGAATVQLGTGTGSLTNSEITKILFNTTLTNLADAVNQADSAHSYAFGPVNAGAATITGANGVTTFNVALEGIKGNSGDVANLTTNFTNVSGTTQVGTGTINLASTGTDDAAAPMANTTGVITAQSNGGALTNTVVNVTGVHDLTIGGLATKGTVDASGFFGKLVVTGSLAGDTFTLGSAADTVNETFTAAVAPVNGAGGSPASASSTYTNLDTINSFTKADTLTLSNVTFAANGTGLTKFDASNAVSFEQALTSAEQTTDGTKAAYFNYQGNTFVVSNTDAANTAIANGSNDLVVKITGVQTLTADVAGIHGA